MFIRVYFKDEAPMIGSGYRTVFVIGADQDLVTLVNPYTLRVAKLPRKVWAELDRTGVELDLSLTEMADKASDYFDLVTRGESEEDGPKSSRIAMLRPGLRILTNAAVK